MNAKRYLSAISVLLLTVTILVNPSKSLEFSLNGLNLWFQKMIPTLFPFMVLSGIIIRMDLTSVFVKVLRPVLYPVFRVRSACLYGIIIGFFCGFPMGANVTALLYEKKQITQKEAEFLLSFCNNIGPIYFVSFALPTLSISYYVIPLLIMYGLPILYGVFLRYTVFRSLVSSDENDNLKNERSISLFMVMDESIWSALESILRLGGYMVFFNLLFIIPYLFVSQISCKSLLILQNVIFCLFEITGGIGYIQNILPVLVLCILPFGGCCCMAQTYSILNQTGLSMTHYVMHKMTLTAITVVSYLLLSFSSRIML